LPIPTTTARSGEWTTIESKQVHSPQDLIQVRPIELRLCFPVLRGSDTASAEIRTTSTLHKSLRPTTHHLIHTLTFENAVSLCCQHCPHSRRIHAQRKRCRRAADLRLHCVRNGQWRGGVQTMLLKGMSFLCIAYNELIYKSQQGAMFITPSSGTGTASLVGMSLGE
jgi:hypothetical protein